MGRQPTAGTSSSKTDLGMIARLVLTIALLLLSAVWLLVVYMNLSIEPKVSEDGKIIFDQFARAKDVLLAVLPLLTLALGYWFGTQGTAKAEEKADDAKKEAKAADGQVKALLAVGEPDLIAKAQAANPEAFGLPGGQ